MGQAQRRAGKVAQARGRVRHAAQSRRAISADDSITSVILPSVAMPGSRCGPQKYDLESFGVIQKHTVVIGGEIHRCGMRTIVIATSSGRLVGRAMHPCFTCRGVKYNRGSCSARTRGLRASPCTRQCWEGDGLKDDANRALRRNMGRGSTLDHPPGARLRRQAPDPEHPQRPEERFNFPGFTGALER